MQYKYVLLLVGSIMNAAPVYLDKESNYKINDDKYEYAPYGIDIPSHPNFNPNFYNNLANNNNTLPLPLYAAAIAQQKDLGSQKQRK